MEKPLAGGVLASRRCIDWNPRNRSDRMIVALLLAGAIFLIGGLIHLHYDERYSWKGGGAEGFIVASLVILIGFGIIYLVGRIA